MAYKVGMVSLGCPKNQVDGEMMLSKLSEDGFLIVNDAAEADVILVNTCGFIDDAKRESIDNILEMAQFKEKGSLKALVVTGCLAERYREEIMAELPEVDAVLGLGANGSIAGAIHEVLQGKRLERFPEKTCMTLSGSRTLTTPPYYAYLRVADGCDNRCTYCAIPMIRGSFRSRPMEDVVQEAETLAAQGVKELVVIAQDTSRYGLDLYGELMLPALLKKLCRIDGIRWIRILYAYPDTITPELMGVMATEEKVVKYLDLPLQHAAGPVLKAMNRRGDKESLLRLVRTLREKVSGIALRTTLIVGFPGEGEAEFEQLDAFVQEAGFDHLGCFTYSPEEGTPAALMDDQIDEQVKIRRQEIIMQQQALVSARRLEAYVGETVPVLVGNKTRDGYAGRMDKQAPEIDGSVLFEATEELHPGQLVEVLVTGHNDYDLMGRMTAILQ